MVRARLRLSKLLRYGVASIVTTILTLALIGLLLLNLTPLVANLVAVGVGSVVSFELNRRWVWRQAEAGLDWRQPLLFIVISLLFLVVSSLAVREVVTALPRGDSLWRSFAVEAATVGVFGLRWMMQYVVFDRLLFREG
jgi:putative flippase GtrA